MHQHLTCVKRYFMRKRVVAKWDETHAHISLAHCWLLTLFQLPMEAWKPASSEYLILQMEIWNQPQESRHCHRYYIDFYLIALLSRSLCREFSLILSISLKHDKFVNHFDSILNRLRFVISAMPLRLKRKTIAQLNRSRCQLVVNSGQTINERRVQIKRLLSKTNVDPTYERQLTIDIETTQKSS